MDQPNTNLINPQNFTLIFTEIPALTFNLTGTTMPGISGGSISVPTPFQPIHLSGTGFQHEPLVAQVIVNEDLSSYYEIVKWIKRRTISESFQDYNDQAESKIGITSSATLQFYTSANNPSKIITFEDIFPISLSGFTLSAQVSGEPQPITFQAVFEYQTFKISS